VLTNSDAMAPDIAITVAISTRPIAFMFSSPIRLGRYTSLS
jgi:hypothetical protein